MQNIIGASEQEMRWSQPSAMRREYELRSGGEVLATLKFRSSCGTLATAESDDGCWTFKRTGFWQNRAGIRACGSDTDLAMFQNNTWDGGGSLAFSNGRQIKATTNVWMTHLEFRTLTDEPLVTFDYGGVFHRSAEVRVSPLARHAPDSSLLVLFGWYLVIMLDSDHGAGAVVTTM